MPIAFDAAGSTTGAPFAQSTASWSHTCGSASNRVLLIGIGVASTTNRVTSVLVDGVNITANKAKEQIGSVAMSTVYYQLNPSVGAHTITVNFSGGETGNCQSVSYSGVSQVGFPNATGGATSATATVTVVTNVVTTNAWVAMFGFAYGAGADVTAGTGTTLRQAATHALSYVRSGFGDSNGPQAAGNYSMTMSCTTMSSGTFPACNVAFYPYIETVVKTIGTSVGATATGTVTATNASTAVTGSGTLFTTEFAGPTTIEIAGVLYNIASITSDTALTLYSNYLGTTGSGKTIKKGVRHFSILYAWDDSSPASLVATDQIWRGEMYNDSEFVGAVAGPMIEIGFITTDALRYRELTAAAGQSFQDHASVRTNPLKYDATKGVALRQLDNDYTVIHVRTENCARISRLQIRNAGNSGICLTVFQGYNSLVKDCFLVGNVNGSQAVFLTWAGETVINVVVVQTHATGKTVIGENLVTPTFTGCTFIRTTDNAPSGTAIQLNYQSINLISSAVFGFARIAYRSNGTTVVPDGGSSKNNATDLSSGLPGSSNQHSVTYSGSTPFTSAASSTLDMRPVVGTVLYGNGYRDSTNAPYDISLTSRISTPTIGAWELVIPDQAVTTTAISSGTSLAAPTVARDQAVTGATISATTTITAPTVTPAITHATIPSTSVVYAATLAYVLLGATIGATAAVSAPTVTPLVAEATIDSTAVLYSPTVIPPTAFVSLGVIASGHTLHVPFILPQWYIFFSFLPPTTVLHGPQVGYLTLPATGATISSTAVLHPVIVVPVFDTQGTFIASSATTYPVSLTTAYEIVLAFLSSHATVYRPRVGTVFTFDIFIADAVMVRFVVLADALDCTPTWPRQAGDLDMTNLQLRRGSDQVVTLPHLRSELDGTFMNAADVIAELVDGEGDVVQSAEMIYVLGSDGMYVWSIEGPLFMHRVSTRYELVITALENDTHFRSVTPVSVID